MSSTGRPPGRPSALLPCPSCPGRTRLPLPLIPAACNSCRRALPIQAPEAVQPGTPVATCALCGDDKLYIQKDLNQGVGCAVLAVGAALVPWTWGLSLGVCALIDFLLHRMLPPLTVCYVCDARYRGVPVHPQHRPFDLMTAQTWEARRINWRRLNSAEAESSAISADEPRAASVDTTVPPP